VPETAPQGIKAVPYPNLQTEKNDTLYVCEKCRPQWDTFDKVAAEAHAKTDIHNPELLRSR
jgi:hypothetical protein